MSLELNRESIRFNHKAGSQTSQLLLEGDVIVPDVRPDINSILRVGGKILIDDVRSGDDRVNFQGELRIVVIYQAKKAEKLIHSMTATIPIEDFIHLDELNSSAFVKLDAQLEHLEYKLINDRKINIKAVVDIQAEVENETVTDIVKDVNGCEQMQILPGRMIVNHTVEDKKDRFIVKEQLNLPAGKPNIRDILDCDISICDKEVRAMEGKVLIKGILELCILYVGDNDESIIEVMEAEVPFNGYIDSKDTQDDMMASAKLSVWDQDIQVIPDEDGEDRAMEIELTIGTDMKVSKNEEIDLIEDAYYIGEPLDIQRETVSYPEFVGSNKTKSSIKETIAIDGIYPDMMQIIHAFGRVSLDDTELIEDRVIAEGVIFLDVMYIAQNDTNPISVVPVSIPFRQEIEIKGAKEGMEVDITAAIEDISYSMLSNREVEIRVTLGFDVLVTKEENGTIITDILQIEDGKEVFDNLASAVIYVVQKGDSLWKIAKRYNTTIEEIVQLNEIENPDKIYPGEKLLVLKKVAV